MTDPICHCPITPADRTRALRLIADELDRLALKRWQEGGLRPECELWRDRLVEAIGRILRMEVGR